jgi:hypothetical protein
MQLLRKIVTKAVIGGNITDKPEKPRALYSVIGVVNAIKPDKTNYGAFYRLHGAFEAVNYADGEVFKSGQCILPEPVGSLIGAALLDLQKKNTRKVEHTDKDGKKTTEEVVDPLDARFAYEIGIKPNKTPMGFEYTAKPLVDIEQNDPLTALRGQIKALLPAPAKK